MKKLLLSIAILLPTTASFAVTEFVPAQKLQAHSQATAAATGNAILEQTIIRFENGESLAWRSIIQEGNYEVFEILSANNPTLLNGKPLCEESLLIRATTKDLEEGIIEISLFDETVTEADETLHQSEGACATFLYRK